MAYVILCCLVVMNTASNPLSIGAFKRCSCSEETEIEYLCADEPSLKDKSDSPFIVTYWESNMDRIPLFCPNGSTKLATEGKLATIKKADDSSFAASSEFRRQL